MATKTISITEEAYERLLTKKRSNDSFSDVINRITHKVSLLDFAGILNHNESSSIEKSIIEGRKRSKKRFSGVSL